MALGGGHHVFGAVVNDLHWLARLPRQKRGMTGDHRRVLFLATESTAGSHLDHSDLVLRQPEELHQGLVDVVGTLHGAPDGHALFGACHRHHSLALNVELLLGAGSIFAFDDGVRMRPDGIDVPFFHLDGLQDIVLAPDHFFSPQRVFESENRRQRLDVDPNGTPSFLQQVLVGVGQESDRFFRVVNDPVGQAGLVVEDQGHIVFSRNVFGGHDGEFLPRQIPLPGNPPDAPSRARAADGHPVHHTREGKVVRVARLAGDFVETLLARNKGADKPILRSGHTRSVFDFIGRLPPNRECLEGLLPHHLRHGELSLRRRKT